MHSLSVSEILLRSAKHVYTTYMQGLEMTYLSVAVSHILNCLFASVSQVVSTLKYILNIFDSK